MWPIAIPTPSVPPFLLSSRVTVNKMLRRILGERMHSHGASRWRSLLGGSGTAASATAASASSFLRRHLQQQQQQQHRRSYNQMSDSEVHFRFLRQPKTVSIVGVPLGFGQPLQGVDRGPLELRQLGLRERLAREGWIVNDLGDIAVADPPKDAEATDRISAEGMYVKWPRAIGKVNQDTAEAVAAAAENRDFVLTLGGDHSIAIGSIAGVLQARPDTGVIWVDAHADINTPKTSLTGNLHGMCVSFLMKHPECLGIPGFDWLDKVPALQPNRIVYVGLRDLDKLECKIIRQLGIKAFTMHDVDKHGIGRVMDMAVEHVKGRVDRPIHLSLDIDGVDPVFAPATGTRVGGGLSYREAYYLAEAICDTGLLTSMDVVEVNSAISTDRAAADLTINMGIGLISSALGNRIL